MTSETSEHVIADFANKNTSNNNTVSTSTRFRWDKEQKMENLQITRPKWNSQIRTFPRGVWEILSFNVIPPLVLPRPIWVS